VFCEGFKQWVLEDHFPAGRPRLEQVGVTFVDDVAPYELMKIRILNGGHATIAYPAALMGIHFVHEAMDDPLVRGFLRRVEHEEIVPTVPRIAGTDLSAYCATVERRFANPRIGDTVERLCHDGSDRQPKFILPSVADGLRAGRGVSGLALVSAFWARYCYGETEAGTPVVPSDPRWPRLQAHAQRARHDPRAWLAMDDVYGELGREPHFVTAFSAALDAVWAMGTRETLRRFVAEPPAA
jgi:mannitol 2-dehydrogenase